MQIHIIAVGKVKERGIRAALDDYLKRIGRYGRVFETELKDSADVEARFRKALPERSRIVAMEVEGKAMSSHRFADFIGGCENQGVQSVAFLIGGSYGLPASLSKEADLQLSLSKMIFPHRLARLFLAEQIYRAFSILRNEPYSH
ncbi:MAG: 23S rRNA (pseudouridine(1915)-N(3))-methyltransferase RlmH [Myxococcota bacterium]